MSSNILYKVMLNESLKIYKKPIPNPCAAGPIPAGGTNDIKGLQHFNL